MPAAAASKRRTRPDTAATATTPTTSGREWIVLCLHHRDPALPDGDICGTVQVEGFMPAGSYAALTKMMEAARGLIQAGGAE